MTSLAVFAGRLEQWAAAMEHWELSFRQGHDFGRPGMKALHLAPLGGTPA